MGAFAVVDVAVGLATVGLLWSFVQSRKRQPSRNLPPGPPGLPLVGNLLDLPRGFEAAHWAKFHSKYGPISSVQALGQTLIILNDVKIAFDLLEKRSAIYSERPKFNFAGDMCGFRSILTLLQTGEEFRSGRKKMHAYIGGRAVDRFADLEWKHTLRFLSHLLKAPENVTDHIRRTAGGIILEISHGYHIENEKTDVFIDLAEKTLDAFSLSMSGPWMVDLIPMLEYLPDWVPGTGFKQKAKEWKRYITDLVEKPYTFVENQRRSGVADQSFTSDAIDAGFKDDVDERILKWTAAAMYGGGADTTVSAVSTFFLAMTLHPEVVKRAQEELDSVMGGAIPRLEDRSRLPYCDAIVKESLRWENVLPSGIAHVVARDDTYAGYDIPQGAWIIPNVWQMFHDPTQYHDPFKFKPERFLGPNPERDPTTMAFGFGRRICPGKDLADPSVFLSVAMTLSVFDISKMKDQNGKVIEPVYEYTPGVISHPKPFKCSITPRSTKHADIVRTLEKGLPRDVSDSDKLQRIFDS